MKTHDVTTPMTSSDSGVESAPEIDNATAAASSNADDSSQKQHDHEEPSPTSTEPRRDSLICGDCAAEFALADLTVFIEHKASRCEKAPPPLEERCSPTRVLKRRPVSIFDPLPIRGRDENGMLLMAARSGRFALRQDAMTDTSDLGTAIAFPLRLCVFVLLMRAAMPGMVRPSSPLPAPPSRARCAAPLVRGDLMDRRRRRSPPDQTKHAEPRSVVTSGWERLSAVVQRGLETRPLNNPNNLRKRMSERMSSRSGRECWSTSPPGSLATAS
uniref:BCL-11A-like CCHC zinc finger domain-containing protein n=1 Tax=Plectus sambesii TaxID=2011161 RepID=A0A914X3I0_9BILA